MAQPPQLLNVSEQTTPAVPTVTTAAAGNVNMPPTVETIEKPAPTGELEEINAETHEIGITNEFVPPAVELDSVEGVVETIPRSTVEYPDITDSDLGVPQSHDDNNVVLAENRELCAFVNHAQQNVVALQEIIELQNDKIAALQGSTELQNVKIDMLQCQNSELGVIVEQTCRENLELRAVIEKNCADVNDLQKRNEQLLVAVSQLQREVETLRSLKSVEKSEVLVREPEISVPPPVRKKTRRKLRHRSRYPVDQGVPLSDEREKGVDETEPIVKTDAGDSGPKGGEDVTHIVNPPGPPIAVSQVPVSRESKCKVTTSGYQSSHSSSVSDDSGSALSSGSGMATDVCARPKQRRRHRRVVFWNGNLYRKSDTGYLSSDVDSYDSESAPRCRGRTSQSVLPTSEIYIKQPSKF